MPSVLESAIGAIIGIIGLLVYATIYASLNKEALPAAATSMLVVIPVILSAVIVVSIVLTGFALRG